MAENSESHVIVYDPAVDPSHDDQEMDTQSVRRIGETPWPSGGAHLREMMHQKVFCLLGSSPTNQGLIYDTGYFPSMPLLQYMCTSFGAPDIVVAQDGLPWQEEFLRMVPPFVVVNPLDFDLLSSDYFLGKTTFVHFPALLPFRDEPPYFSMKSWARLFKQALNQHEFVDGKPTAVILLYPSRLSTVDPTYLPLLDARMDLDCLRRWRTHTVVLPGLKLDYRDNDGLLRMSPASHDKSLLLHAMNSTARFPEMHLSVEYLCRLEAHPDIFFPVPTAVQVHITYPKYLPAQGMRVREISPVRLLMMLEGCPADDRSSVWLDAPTHRYPPDSMPRVQRHSPERVGIAQMTIPPNVLQNLIEDRENHGQFGINWVILDDALHRNLFLVSHAPKWPANGKPPLRDEADEVIKTVQATSLRDHFEILICFSKYDALGKLHPTVDARSLASTLKECYSFQLRDANQLKNISSSTRKIVVSPPNVLVRGPEGILMDQMIAVMQSFCPVVRVNVLPKIGQFVFELPTPQHAELLYGTSAPTPAEPVLFTTGSEDQDKHYIERFGVRSLDVVLQQVRSLGAAPTLTAANLAGLEPSQPDINVDLSEFRSRPKP